MTRCWCMLAALLCTLGHVATSRQLRAHGITARALRRGVDDGAARRIRQGTYACTHVDPAVAEAARVGGAVTCVTALRVARVWAGHDDRLHLLVPPTRSGISVHVMRADVRLHWQEPRFGLATPWITTPLESLWRAMNCLGEEDGIAAMESAIHEKFLTSAQVRGIASIAPRKLRDGVRRMVTSSGSGNETIVRLRLDRAGYRVESQSFVPGMGHEDLVVEDCVGLDVDGRRWHGEDRFAIDRDRDIHVEGLGRRALRLRPAHIHASWPHTLAVIDRAVTDAMRERQRRTGRVIVGFDDPL